MRLVVADSLIREGVRDAVEASIGWNEGRCSCFCSTCHHSVRDRGSGSDTSSTDSMQNPSKRFLLLLDKGTALLLQRHAFISSLEDRHPSAYWYLQRPVRRLIRPIRVIRVKRSSLFERNPTSLRPTFRAPVPTHADALRHPWSASTSAAPGPERRHPS